MSDAAIPFEVEAKLLAKQPSDLRTIARLTQIGAYRIRWRDDVRLHSLYLDTADFTLARSGIALRLRRQGQRWEATAKWAGTVEHDVHRRPELNVGLAHHPVLPFGLPQGALRQHLLAYTSGQPLNVIFRSFIARRRFDVLAIDAGGEAPPLAELALDHVRLQGPGGAPTTRYCEVEVECVHGQHHDVQSLARLLQRAYALTPSPETKFSQGILTVYGPALLRRQETRLTSNDTVASAVRKIFRHHLEQLRRSDPLARGGEDPEGVHDMRVATRRLRALLRAFPNGLPVRMRSGFDRELRWLAQVLGSVRDLDVQLQRLAKDRAAAPPRHRAGLEGLEKHLKAERRRQRVALLNSLDSTRYLDLLQRIDGFTQTTPHPRRNTPQAQPVAEIGRYAVKKAVRRLVKRVERVESTPAPEDLHTLRIRAKRLRYVLEFLADLTGKAGARLVRHLVLVQDLLGTYHDAMVAADAVQNYVEKHAGGERPANLLALGTLVSGRLRDADAARDGFHKVWVRFRRKRTRRELHAVLARLEKLATRAAKHTPATSPQKARSAFETATA